MILSISFTKYSKDMTNLSDLPEELLSQICNEIELDSLISLATCSRLFNRIAGNLYLRHAWYPVLEKTAPLSESVLDANRLLVSNQRNSEIYISFDTLQNMTRILGSMSNVRCATFRFSKSAIEALKQLRLVVFTSRAAHRQPYYSITFEFLHCQERNPSLSRPFIEALGNLLHEVRCKSLTIYGTVPIDRGSLDISLPINNYLEDVAISYSFINSQPHWIPGFLNSFSSLCVILTETAKEWTEILPELHLPSLRNLTFYGSIPYTETSHIKVLAEFINRHQSLTTLNCGEQFTILPIISPTCLSQPSNLRIMQGSISQLHYLLSSGAFSPQNIAIQWEQIPPALPFGTDQLWDLLTLISSHSTIQNLRLCADSPPLKHVLFSESPSESFRRYNIPHVLSLEVNEFQSLTEIAQYEFLGWACKVFPCIKTLRIDWLQWDLGRKSSFIQAVTEEWASVNILEIDFKDINLRQLNAT